ncbi:dehydrogenase/reductase SDR family protein 13 [Krasilnikovia cinnamomea]|uniref:Dehydrogenase/reductase SDR family protein 13 n=1 Tax=Krasilnikovia cinnamomea TaxID=349313 RepID=A0A4Q7ZLR6_9ACTN|nr:SDR family NAD(P)-dependent oxidoreductase [Krasilnikovia cinnamomea]RZU51179.1 dehydrogenase/reductase SDR family protein 13 [Krasilnikovia cinnamomea]
MSDLTGATAVVTGGTDGIGAATVRLLRDRGADVIAIGRSAAKAEALRAQEAAAGRDRGRLDVRLADLGSMAAVVRAVAALDIERVDVVVQAVGVLLTRAEYTEEGLEKDFAISYLGRYLFLEEAHRTGLIGTQTRLVNLAASAPRIPRIAQVEFPSADEVAARTGMRAHGQAQLANDLLTALAPRRYGISAVGYGPGAVDTNIRREVPAIARALLRPFYALATRRPEEAAADVVAAATDQRVEPGTASFRNRRGAFPAPAYVTDERRQHELLGVSAELVRRALDRPTAPSPR